MTPLQQAAYDIGAKGADPTEEERLAFESWMRGHCWAVVGDWDGKQYKHDCEDGEFIHGGAMGTRRLWAAWRDRGAVARVLAGQAQKVEPFAWVVLDYEGVPIYCAPAKQMCNDHVNEAISEYCIAEAGGWIIREAFTHPVPPPASDRASLIRRADASVTALNSRIMEPFYCSLDQDAARVLSDCVDMLEADVSLINEGNKAQQVAVPTGCHRSHPHEEMSEVCKLKTEIARLKAAHKVDRDDLNRLDEQRLESLRALEAERNAALAQIETMTKDPSWFALKAERDALAADAGRYRWLRRSATRLSFDNALIGSLVRDQSELDGAMEAA